MRVGSSGNRVKGLALLPIATFLIFQVAVWGYYLVEREATGILIMDLLYHAGELMWDPRAKKITSTAQPRLLHFCEKMDVW